jgi:hypothetical protein
VTTDLTFLAGAASEEGQIRMFAGECPAGWTTYEELADRFPRGIAAGGWATAQENQTGGSSTLTVDYGHTGLYSDITVSDYEDWEDVEWMSYFAAGEELDDNNVDYAYKALSQLSIRQTDGTEWCDPEDEDCINTQEEPVASGSETMDFVPSYAYINYCKKL